jgi:hypothetical protein
MQESSGGMYALCWRSMVQLSGCGGNREPADLLWPQFSVFGGGLSKGLKPAETGNPIMPLSIIYCAHYGYLCHLRVFSAP